MTGLDAQSIPQLPRGVRVHHDQIRKAHVLLAPERAFDLDAIALEVLRLVDGKRSVRDIACDLATRFDADQGVIEADVLDMLNGLAERRILSTKPRMASGPEHNI